MVVVEIALRQQLTKEIEPAYVEELRNPISNVIEHPSNVIFETLFRNYGAIKTGELIKKYTNYLPSIIILISRLARYTIISEIIKT